jgi:RNA polymerase sigma-70 factor (ECF subfamily)
VTLNQCYDGLRRRPATGLEAAADVPDGAPAPDKNMEDAAVSAEVDAALQELPERQRAAILLCHYQERGNIEAADMLGISVEALESLLARGRRTLRTKLSHLREGA